LLHEELSFKADCYLTAEIVVEHDGEYLLSRGIVSEEDWRERTEDSRLATKVLEMPERRTINGRRKGKSHLPYYYAEPPKEVPR
jgi:hypothetical protein